ncbi:ABC transporter ATP-binding protein [Candidatus Gracilibacteria bacterium]|nr:ABC transporter ATP-binding protein [Candidatus Gracilibacteria bacterium]NUJ99162.1 ABC transporter ATP-binding protein [Candidatus Gracilibacteria bacterium]
MIELRNIKKVYSLGNQEIEVLKGINLKIEKGDFISIMGPSGSGKSTLMNIIGMLDIPSFGEYIFDGKRIDDLGETRISKIRASHVGFVFQSYNLISRMNVLKQVILPLSYQGIGKKERIQRAKEALKRVGLETKMYNKPNELSGGQQQRVSIARAIAVDPDIILADEPTGALDTQTGIEIMGILKELNEKEGKTIILITHEPDIDKYAKKHIRIQDGLIL